MSFTKTGKPMKARSLMQKELSVPLTRSHTMTPFDASRKESF